MAGNKKGFAAGCQSVNIDLIYEGLPRIPEEGSELYAKNFSVQMGGGYPGTLCNLARLGVPVKLMTRLGTDMFSAFAQNFFKEAGLETVNLTPDTKGIPLNISAAMLTPGDRTFVSYGGRSEWTAETEKRVLEEASGAKLCLLDPEHPELYRKLKEQGTVLVLDTGWDDGMSLASYGPLLELADYYTPNQKEAMKLTGTDTPEAAAEILSGYFPKVIVKLDSAGCLIMEDGKASVVPAVPGTVFRDATGAGDAFLAGFLYGLYHDFPFRKCAVCGNILGAKCVTAVGCLTAWYTEEEFLAVLEKQEG